MATTTTTGAIGSAGPGASDRTHRAAPLRSTAAASRTALYALLLRDLTVLRKHLVEFVLRTIIQPFLLVFVFLYVFPEIGQSVGGRGAVVPSPPCWCPAWWASRSCSRASSRWPCSCRRSSGSPGRSRTGSRRPARSGWWRWPRSWPA